MSYHVSILYNFSALSPMPWQNKLERLAMKVFYLRLSIAAILTVWHSLVYYSGQDSSLTNIRLGACTIKLCGFVIYENWLNFVAS
jgi:hypothetical protein